MRYELFIAWRYLRARKEAFVTFITVIATAGVAIGVMTLTVVLAIMTGFEEDLRDRILGFNPHVVVLGFAGSSIGDYRAMLETVRDVPGVASADPYVYGQVMLSTGKRLSGALVRGVDPTGERMARFAEHLATRDLTRLQKRHAVPLSGGRGDTVMLPGIVIGAPLAFELGVGIGDAVSVISPLGTPTAVGMVPRIKRFVVVDLFDSGMAEYDSVLAYMALADAQHFFGLDDAVTGLEIEVTDLYAAGAVADEIEARLGMPYPVRDWMEVNQNILAALRLEKTVYFIVLSLIILVAAFNIVATLVMVVMEKRKDIAILKSMGAARSSIARIFVLKGLIIGCGGTALGNLLGWGACAWLDRFKLPLPPGVFYTDTVPVRLYPEYFLVVTTAAVAICFLATLYPARQAARLAPVDIIRYE